MAQRLVQIDFVMIAAAVAHLLQDLAILQLADDALHRTFGDSNPCGNIPQPRRRILCQAHEHMRVVAKKSPGMIRIQGPRPGKWRHH